MNNHRRKALKAGSVWTVVSLAVAAGLIRPSDVFAWVDYPNHAFGAKSIAELMQVLGASLPVQSKDITLIAPDIAENGTQVSMEISSQLPNTTELALLVANNPSLLVAQLILPINTLARVNLRVKMEKSSDVYALAKVNGKYYFAKKMVRVTLGGCGA